MTKSLIATVAVLALAGTVAAQDKKPAAAPAPAAPAAAAAPAAPEPTAFMKPFEGTWKCETKFPANAMGPGKPEVTAKSTVKFKKDLDGFFYRGEFETKKQKGVDMTMKGVFYIGYDPATQQLLFTTVDNMGSLGTAAGKIEGDTVNYTGEAH